MKTKLTKRFSKLIAILAFLALLAGNAFAVENKSRVVSPYWQSDSGSYTFIAVSHTSLSGMASQIGLTVNALTNANSTFGTAVSFTITSGTTTRVFLVRTNHATVNSTSIPTGQFITGTTDFTHGHVRIDPSASNPETKVSTGGNIGDGYQDATMLSFWGSVVIEQNTTGFAMEFIGDMSDSQATQHLLGASTTPQVVGPAAP
ncbi:MAG: hypothetical protein H8E42_11090 [Nitrospinae bacterium]|nr:hypothetical protein [Nitrospinota bacterium]MBL7021090.1 hypothetical protein [Nitrospinaceae bacterium]